MVGSKWSRWCGGEEAWLSLAWQGLAGHDKAWRGMTRLGLAWQGLAGHDKARLGSNLEEALWTARCM